jgi:starch synthase (maltosyl-transferring)
VKGKIFMMNPIKRVVIANVRPVVAGGCSSIHWVVGDKVRVKADIFSNGHEQLAGELLFRKEGGRQWQVLPMAFVNNDEWYSAFRVSEAGTYEYTVQAWIDRFRTWLSDVAEKTAAGQNVNQEMVEGSRIVAVAAELSEGDDRQWLVAKARFLGSEESCKERMRIAADPDLSRLMDAYADKSGVSVYNRVLRATVDPSPALLGSCVADAAPLTLHDRSRTPGNR